MTAWFVAYHRWIDRPFVFWRSFDGEKIAEQMKPDEWKVIELNCRYIDLPFPHFYVARDIDRVAYVESYEVSMEGR